MPRLRVDALVGGHPQLAPEEWHPGGGYEPHTGAGKPPHPQGRSSSDIPGRHQQVHPRRGWADIQAWEPIPFRPRAAGKTYGSLGAEAPNERGQQIGPVLHLRDFTCV